MFRRLRGIWALLRLSVSYGGTTALRDAHLLFRCGVSRLSIAVGPYRHPDARRIVETEIYDTIQRRGVVGNLMMGLIPMVFYAWINLAALVMETVWNVVTAVGRPFAPRTSGQSWSKARRFQSDFEPLSPA